MVEALAAAYEGAAVEVGGEGDAALLDVARGGLTVEADAAVADIGLREMNEQGREAEVASGLLGLLGERRAAARPLAVLSRLVYARCSPPLHPLIAARVWSRWYECVECSAVL